MRIQSVLEKDAECRPFHDGENPLEDDQTHKQTGHGKAITANPVEIALGTIFSHEEEDAGTPNERGNRKEVEGTQKKIQGEDNEERKQDKARFAGERVRREELVGT